MTRAALEACATASKHYGDRCEQHAQHRMPSCPACGEDSRRYEQVCNNVLPAPDAYGGVQGS